jgi:antitoxin ParD1/3/4
MPALPDYVSICYDLTYGEPPMPNVHLTKQMQDYAEAQIESGAYANLSEVVREGMRSLMEKDRLRAFRELKAELELALAEAEAGDHAPFDIEAYEPDAFR